MGDEQMETARHVFAELAPLIAARRSMRLWNPTAVPSRFADRAQTLTHKLPDKPAAVPIYLHGRTRLLVLDFDAKHGHSPATVDHHVEHCLTLLHACGALTVSDRSTSGGRHILVPLAEGTTLPRTEIEPVLRALADRLPSLDITPMLNDRTGSITPPGSRCRDYGFRTLDGTLDHAAHALTVRSPVTFWPSFARLLSTNTGSGPSAARDDDRVRAGSRTSRAGSRATAPTSNGTPPDDPSRAWEGAGDHARLRARYRRHTPIPAVVLAFAREGHAPQQRWRAPNGRVDRSAARQSVLTAAALRGYSFTDLLAELPSQGGTWTGLADAYHRYGAQSHRALRRDWNSACHWTSRHAPEFLSHAHKNIKHTGGPTRATKHTGPQRRWLASAIAWTDAQWPNSPKRWTAHAALQALAHASTLNGAVHRGTPTVEFGGRSLSLMAGGMPETTLWQILREIRDLPGAPILRIRAATGHLADRYALITANLAGAPIPTSRARIARTPIQPVHPAWRVIGLRCRRLYETILDGTTNPADAFAAAALGRTAGYTALATLTTTGLIHHTHKTVRAGSTTLDHIARAHGLPARRQNTIARHRRERADWAAWLSARTSRPPRAPRTTSQAIPVRTQSKRTCTGTDRHGLRTTARSARTTPSEIPHAKQTIARRPSTTSRPHQPTPDTFAAPPIAIRGLPLTDAEIYIEATPRLGGHWLVLPDATTLYQRSTGTLTASTVPAALLRASSTWTQLHPLSSD
ncbi:hypothetical protein OG225_07250 [Nocardia sp. NBC_01377]|uniref:hypothetical protein n=1 Tax=Nocardia sp. NBC_01377 TaxID=2903595 RepID=UPI003246A334